MNYTRDLRFLSFAGIILLPLTITVNASMEDMTKNSIANVHSMKVNVMANGSLESPLKQFKSGTLNHDIKCNNRLVLVLKFEDGHPACVKPLTANALAKRGWIISDNIVTKSNDIILPVRHMSNYTMNSKIVENNTIVDRAPVNESQFKSSPTLVGIDEYINTTPAKLAQEMKGKVIVYDFWTFNCINCIHTIPHVVDLYSKYLGKNVLVIGVHSPETFFEKDPNNVRDAVHKYNIQYPVVMDNQFQTWNAFGNHYWPHVYISDWQGKIRYDHIGEGAYDEIDKTVSNLLSEQEKGKSRELVMS